MQYQPSSGRSAWQVTPLAGSVPGGSAYLIGEAAGASGTIADPQVVDVTP